MEMVLDPSESYLLFLFFFVYTNIFCVLRFFYLRAFCRFSLSQICHMRNIILTCDQKLTWRIGLETRRITKKELKAKKKLKPRYLV